MELPDGPWPDPESAAAGSMSPDANEDAVSLYEQPLAAGMVVKKFIFMDFGGSWWVFLELFGLSSYV